MALSRLLLGIFSVVVLAGNLAMAQFESTSANQTDLLVTDALGRFFSADANGVGTIIFDELQNNSQKLGFVSPIVKDVELVANPDGTVKGAYAVDIRGGQFALTARDPGLPVTAPVPARVSSPAEVGSNSELFNVPVFFGFDVIRDIEIAPDWRDTTHGYKGYFVLDADGVVHSLGNTNLPNYVYSSDPDSTDISNAEIVFRPFPETIDVSGSSISSEALLQGGPLNIPMNTLFGAQDVNSVTPIFTYFGLGSDVARDLEVSVQIAQVTIPSRDFPGVIETREIAMTNGYYILDSFGAVHSSRLPLDFDVNNDGQVLFTDIYENFAENELNPDFGRPINNTPIAPAWDAEPEDIPYFGIDVAVDVEITPSGKGYYLLDAFGGVFAVGDAKFTFPPKIAEDGSEIETTSITPFFGVPFARDLVLVANKGNESLGLIENRAAVGYAVLDGFGNVYTAGLAEDYSITRTGNNGKTISVGSDVFRSIEVNPIVVPRPPGVSKFRVGSDTFNRSIAPNFLNVTAAFKGISAPSSPGSGG